MAGPGGGPPRRSHTKSRNGCKTCKRRHIRCDETFPQCRNCTKHNCRCDYQDIPLPLPLPLPLDNATIPQSDQDLLVLANVEAEVQRWHSMGLTPHLELDAGSYSPWSSLSRLDSLLIHHILGLYTDLDQRGLSDCTIWARILPSFVTIAMSNDFVLRAILSLSAAHFAFLTHNLEVAEYTRRSQSRALDGLQTALSTDRVARSQQDTESIVSALILLSWQVTDFHTWLYLKEELGFILRATPPIWKQDSKVIHYAESREALSHLNQPPSIHENLLQLDCASQALRLVQEQTLYHAVYARHLQNLIDLVQRLRQDLPYYETPEQFFNETRILRRRLLWLLPSLLREAELETSGLVILAQYYAVAATFDGLFPQAVDATLGTGSVVGIDEICRVLASQMATSPQNSNLSLELTLLDFPRYCVARHHGHLAWSSPPSAVDNHPSESSSPCLVLPDNGLHSDSSPRSVSSSYTAPTPPLHSPSASTTANSSYIATKFYPTPAMSSHSLYSPSPQIFDTQNLSQDTHGASYIPFDSHTPFYTSSMTSDPLCSNMPSSAMSGGPGVSFYLPSYTLDMAQNDCV
ncbi:Fungal Zn(2)-Cys(6) binuclear cluster domain-containing protein [Penicillium ucsense]|uniref:Fungal Zn(2)-Cys(6) binuclear cluster domain-containing protein n=1 Tax=Penicillium ucsense TaxID=2839758 RepID=A0A8J8VXV3_9EURO|nr:Fungal Zn(2)-Cys(6) binuclear cluster domain-containing protein [Penicillium ucsense]KAF7729908.1 Fungal Zn(2)-Cys(6) binuclear cluster domain-containing protein [Penicillium ucsense]